MILLAGNISPPSDPSKAAHTGCITAMDGVEALAVLISGTCEKAALGEGMRIWSSLEVLELWRSVDPELPILLVSDTSDLAELRRGVQLGISDFLIGQPDTVMLHSALERLSPAEPMDELDEDLLSPNPKLLTLYRTCIDKLSGKLPAQGCLLAGQRLQGAICQRMDRAYPWLPDYVFQTPPVDSLAELERQLCARLSILHILLPRQVSQSFREILCYILTHMDREPHQPEIAAAFYLGRSTLSQLFLRELGCSFRSYVGECRMLRAASLLSELGAQQVADRLGYQDYSYFTKQFRKRFGLFPAEYQSQERKERKPCIQPTE